MRPTKKKRKNGLWWAFILALLGLLLWDGQTRLVTDEYSCEIARLPDAFEGCRIVQLSDLHGASFGEGNSRLIARITELRPDYIVLTGDIVAEQDDLAVTAELLPRLAAIAPCFYVSGNHEWACGLIEELAAQLRESGVTYLRNEYIPLVRGGETITLCGVEDPNSWAHMVTPDALTEEARAAFPDSPLILLGHRNYWIEKYPNLRADLILCGHGHGGVIRLPGLGGLIGTDRRLFPRYTDGANRCGSYTMVISRGLGNEKNVPRVLNNPEIVSVVLKKAA